MAIKTHPLNDGRWEFVIFFLDQPLEGTDGYKNKMSIHIFPYKWNTINGAKRAAIQTALREINTIIE